MKIPPWEVPEFLEPSKPCFKCENNTPVVQETAQRIPGWSDGSRVWSAEHVGGQLDRAGAFVLGCCRNLISCCTWPGTTLIAAGRLLGLSSTVLPDAREIRRVLVLSQCNCDDPEEPCLLFFGGVITTRALPDVS